MFNYTFIFMTIYQKFNQYKKAAENNKNQPPNFIEDYGIRVINDSDPDREEHAIKDKFDLDVIDNGGTPRKCYTTQNGVMQRSDSVVGSNRLFRATINYCIRVEIDENNRYNVNITKEIKSSLSKM